MSSTHNGERAPSGRALLPNLVLTSSVLLTLLAAYFVSSAVYARDQVRFDTAVRSVGDSIGDRLSIYGALLEGVRAHFDSSDSVTREGFHTFVDSLRAQERYSGIQGIGFAVRSPRGDEAAFAAAARERGVSGVSVWPASDRTEGYPIVFLEPADDRNRVALGFDMYSEPVRREAMDLARDSGRPTVSARVRLVQETEAEVQSGFLIYLPVYRRGAPHSTVEERRANVVGFVYAPFRAGNLFSSIFDGRPQNLIDFEVYAGPDASPDALLYDSRGPGDHAEPSTRFRTEKSQDVPGRSWTIRYEARPEFVLSSSWRLTFYTLLTGLGVSVLLFLIARSQVKARTEAEAYASELLASREQLRSSEARLRRLVDSNLIGIEIVDASGRLIEVNETFLQTIGRSKEEVDAGRLDWDLVKPPSVRARDISSLAAIAANGGESTYETSYIRVDGTEVPVLEGLASFGAQHETVVGFILDLSERKRVETERAALLERERESRQMAEEANRLKDEFLATVSHELRTPLNAILGWSRLLKTGRLDAEAAVGALDTIERNSRSQAQLIEDLLDVSRIMTGNLRIEVEPVDLVPVIEAALASVRPAAAAKSIQIDADLDVATGTVSGDPTRLQQIIWNLLANAVKFTPRAGRVDVRLGAADTYAVVEIRDSGPGIDRSFLPYVFERFRQADSSITRAHGGLGLGLAIVRHLTEMHGGSVSAESEGPGAGALFTVRIPLMGVSLDDSAAVVPGDAEVSLDGVRVLVVDDDADSREVLAVALEQYGADVRTCAEAERALDELAGFKPNVLVSDIAMPGMDGHELIRRVRARGVENYGSIPAIALTAYSRSEDRKSALNAGYQVHMAKPFEPATLAAAVAELARRT